MEITRNGIGVNRDVSVGALLPFAQGTPIAVRERCVAPDYAPMTGEVRLLPVSAVATAHLVAPGVTDDARVRAWSPPD